MPPEARRKILFLTRSLNVGGGERQLVELASGLKRAGWDVKVATFYGGGALEPAMAARGVPLVSLDKRGRWDVLPFIRRLVRLIRSEHPDVVYSMLTMSNVLLALLRGFAGNARIVWGVATSNMDPRQYDWMARLESMLDVRLAHRADLIISNSHAGKTFHVGRGYPPSRTVVVVNGVDTDRFRPDARARDEVRREWGIAPGEILVGIVGRLDPVKDHRNFLAAAAQVGRALGNVRFVSVGSGAEDYERELRAEAEVLEIAPRIRWERERSDIERVYNALDVLVSSSLSEGLTNVLAEGMASGVVCVATDVGDSAGLIAEPRYIAPPADSGALAAAILNAISDLPAARETRREHIVAGFSVAKLVAETARHLESIIGAGSDSRRDLREVNRAPSILLLTRQLDVGGAQRQLVELAMGLHQSGWIVRVATFYPEGPLAADLQRAGVPVVSLDKRGRWDLLGFALRLLALIRRERPDVLHGYLSSSNVLLTLLRPFARGARVVWGVRASNMDLSAYDRLSALEERSAAAISKLADLVICNSEAGRAHHLTQGYPADRTIVIPNGIDVQRFKPDASARAAVRDEWGIAHGECLVGIVARLDPMKDHPSFLQAAAIVARERPHTRFVCVGEGDADYAKGLHEQARALGLGAKLLWAGSRSDVARIYNALDVAVSSSSFGEGFPNSVAEAMASGLPCVVTDVGDSAMIVGSLGWVCPPRDPARLARAIVEATDALPCDAHAIRNHIVTSYSARILLERTAAQLLPMTPRHAVAPSTTGGTTEY